MKDYPSQRSTQRETGELEPLERPEVDENAEYEAEADRRHDGAYTANQEGVQENA